MRKLFGACGLSYAQICCALSQYHCELVCLSRAASACVMTILCFVKLMHMSHQQLGAVQCTQL